MTDSFFTRMPKGRVANVMSQTSSLNNITNISSRMLLRYKPLIKKFLPYSNSQRPTNTGHFQAMRKAIMNVVIGCKWMHLSLSCKTPESPREHYLVMIRVKW